MKKFDFKRALNVVYAAIILVFTVLFFTNDFGIVDIRKTSVVIGAGIDIVENGVRVTTQLAVPQPSENGENTLYTEVDGQGATVADALKEINTKTGFYPKLIFCHLIVLGESCKEGDIFALLDYFYRNEYTTLTPLVAMCDGDAAEFFKMQPSLGSNATEAVGRILDDEGKKSGNVSTVNLKTIGNGQHSAARSCYMPYITYLKYNGGDEDEGQGAPQTGSGGGSQSGGDSEFICNRTALFTDGKFAGILGEEQAFALNLLKNEIRRAVVACSEGDERYSVGLRNCGGGVGLAIEEGQPKVTISFSATAQVQDKDGQGSPDELAERGVLSPQLLEGCKRELGNYFSSLTDALSSADCDALDIRTMLYRHHYGDYEALKEGILRDMQVEYKIDIKSVK